MFDHAYIQNHTQHTRTLGCPEMPTPIPPHALTWEVRDINIIALSLEFKHSLRFRSGEDESRGSKLEAKAWYRSGWIDAQQRIEASVCRMHVPLPTLADSPTSPTLQALLLLFARPSREKLRSLSTQAKHLGWKCLGS